MLYIQYPTVNDFYRLTTTWVTWIYMLWKRPNPGPIVEPRCGNASSRLDINETGNVTPRKMNQIERSDRNEAIGLVRVSITMVSIKVVSTVCTWRRELASMRTTATSPHIHQTNRAEGEAEQGIVRFPHRVEMLSMSCCDFLLFSHVEVPFCSVLVMT